MPIIPVSTKEEALHKAQQKLNSLLSEHSPTSILLLVSGGSAFSLLSGIEQESLGPHVTFGVLDERFSTDPEVNNCAQLFTLQFNATAREQGAHPIDTRVIHNDETIEVFAKRFETELHTWRARNPEGVVVITEGVGPDGHTAGIMPYSEDEMYFLQTFDSPDRFVVGYDAKEKNAHPLRVTVTLPFLRTWVDHSVCYVVGDDKLLALRRIQAHDGTVPETPGRIIREMKDVSLFTTEELFSASMRE